jgi:hypothetical protein
MNIHVIPSRIATKDFATDWAMELCGVNVILVRQFVFGNVVPIKPILALWALYGNVANRGGVVFNSYFHLFGSPLPF